MTSWHQSGRCALHSGVANGVESAKRIARWCYARQIGSDVTGVDPDVRARISALAVGERMVDAELWEEVGTLLVQRSAWDRRHGQEAPAAARCIRCAGHFVCEHHGARCAVCAGVLHPLLVAHGEHVHPLCED